MKILIVGGTGLTGAAAALHLNKLGHNITLMARKKPSIAALQDFAFMQGDYINDDIQAEKLQGFDALVFAAGADLRMLPEGESEQSFFTRANIEAIPRFFVAAKAAGIKRAAYVGSYYPQIAPESIEHSVYVKSRHLADEAIRALSDDDFCVCSLNAPFIIGHIAGIYAPHLEALVNYCAGRIEGLPVVAPAGGVNHISAESMAEAIAGALERGECGKAYLVGDENLSWKNYFEQFCQAAGNAQILAVSEEEHPMLPDIILYAGRNATVSYTPDNAPLNYATGRISETIKEVVAAYL